MRCKNNMDMVYASVFKKCHLGISQTFVTMITSHLASHSEMRDDAEDSCIFILLLSTFRKAKKNGRNIPKATTSCNVCS